VSGSGTGNDQAGSADAESKVGPLDAAVAAHVRAGDDIHLVCWMALVPA